MLLLMGMSSKINGEKLAKDSAQRPVFTAFTGK